MSARAHAQRYMTFFNTFFLADVAVYRVAASKPEPEITLACMGTTTTDGSWSVNCARFLAPNQRMRARQFKGA